MGVREVDAVRPASLGAQPVDGTATDAGAARAVLEDDPETSVG